MWLRIWISARELANIFLVWRKVFLVFMLEGNLEIGSHVRSNLCFFYLFQAFDLIENSHNRGFFPNRHIFLHACATCSWWLSIISTMGITNIIDAFLTITHGPVYTCFLQHVVLAKKGFYKGNRERSDPNRCLPIFRNQWFFKKVGQKRI